MMALIAGRTSLSGSDGSTGTVPVEFDKAPTAKLESIGAAEYDRGSSSWHIAGHALPSSAMVAEALSQIFRHRALCQKDKIEVSPFWPGVRPLDVWPQSPSQRRSPRGRR